jgi:vancomycin resistance protein VanJ
MMHASVVEILLGLYATGVTVWFVLRTKLGDRVTLVLLGDFLGVWLFVPLFLLIPWAVIARYMDGLPAWSLRLTVLAAIPFVLFLRFYGRALIPPRRIIADEKGDTPAGTSLTVLTFNLLFSNEASEAVQEVLLASEADVLALQEVMPRMNAQLREVLRAHYPYHVFTESAELAVYSRFPILHEEILPFEPWPAQRLTLQIPNETGTAARVHLINAHLAPVAAFPLARRLDATPAQRRASARKAQVAIILDTLPASDNGHAAETTSGAPTIVACDCNMTELNSTYAAMTGRLRDAYRDQGWGLGHSFIIPRGFNIPSPLNIPAQRLDYLFHSDELIAETATVIHEPTGSDHLPVVVRFRLSNHR